MRASALAPFTAFCGALTAPRHRTLTRIGLHAGVLPKTLVASGQKQRNLNKTLRSFGIVKTLRCIVERQRNVARCQDLMLPTTLSHHVHVHMKFYVQLRVQKQNLCMCTHLDVRQMCELNVNVKSYEKEKV